MTQTHAQIASWLDEYFEAANAKQGPVESVAELGKYFAKDLEFWMYTAPPFITLPLSREGLLMTFVHPGIYEKLIPKYYVIDTDSMVAVVQFELRFRDEESGKTWRPLQASAHYHLRADAHEDIRIAKIQYWTESHADGDDFESLFQLWNSAKEEALVEFGTTYFNGSSGA